MLSIGRGYSTSYLTDAVAGGREGYYTAGTAIGEPAGIWWGDGAALLGLAGEVDAKVLEAIYARLVDPRDPRIANRGQWSEAAKLGSGPRAYRTSEEIYAGLLDREPQATPERRIELRTEAEKQATQSLAFLDLTFDAPKSVSVAAVAFERLANEAHARGEVETAAAWRTYQQAVEDAVLAGASASLEYLQEVAGYSRVGHHGGGAGRWTDAHTFVAAQFLQHDSRDRDPHLHVHQALLNKVLCTDGQWRALDTRAIYRFRGAAGAIGERYMEAHLSRSLGVAWVPREDGHGREIAGVSRALCDDLSSRARAITGQLARMADDYRARHGAEPTNYQLQRWQKLAWAETRQAKSYGGESAETRLDRWSAIADAAIAGGLEKTAWDILDAGSQDPETEKFSPNVVTNLAVATLEDKQSTWNTSDTLRAVSDNLPGNLGLAPEQVRPFLEGLTDDTFEKMIPVREQESTENLPATALLADGRSPYQTPGGQRFTSAAVVQAEGILRAAAVHRGAEAMSAEQATEYVGRFAEAGVKLGQDQITALTGVLTSGAWMEVLCAAPGTGKTFAVGAISEAWREAGHRTFGMATSQKATDLLAEEGLDTRNIAQWLAAQDRIAQGRAQEYDADLAIRSGDLVIVDEASMTSSLDLAQIQQRCEQAGAKLLLVGDPHQLSAVGPAGALADAAEHGLRYDLTEVRRFSQDWERQASLALRAGDPAAITQYQNHGRLIDAGTVEQAEQAAANAWLADTLAGRETLLVTGSNEQAARLSAQLRAQLVELGHVSDHGVTLSRDGNTAGIGDIVQARHNGWDHRGWEDNGGAAPVNRKTYQVLGLRADGGLSVARRLAGGDLAEHLELRPEYVAQHLALGYASTAHAAQGRTVDRGHLLYGKTIDAEAALVGMTRGQDYNTVWGITQEIGDEQDPKDVNAVKPTTTAGSLAAMLEANELTQSALAETEQALLDTRSTMTHADRLIEQVESLTAGRASLLLDALTLDNQLSDVDRERLAADDAMWSVDALLRRAELAGHDPRQVLNDAVSRGNFDGAKSAASVLHKRMTTALEGQLEPRVTSHADLIPPQVPSVWHPWLTDRARDADIRREELGALTAEEAPQWAVAALGDVPDDPVERLEWENKAGWAAAYREMSDISSQEDALGSPPPGGLPDKYALWATSHTALGLPEAGAAEWGTSDRLLQLRVAAWEREKNWAPDYVGNELAAVSQAAQRAEQHATLTEAHAEIVDDPDRATALRDEAQEAAIAAERLAATTQQLEHSSAARTAWFTHTAPTRTAAERARTELGRRGVDIDEAPAQTTATEWLEAHLAEQTQDENGVPARPVRDLDDPDIDELRATAEDTPPTTAAETAVPDIREIASPPATETADADDRWRIPTETETTDKVARARDALLEMQSRAELDKRVSEDQRMQELAEWHAEAQAREQQISDQQAAYEHDVEAVS